MTQISGLRTGLSVCTGDSARRYGTRPQMRPGFFRKLVHGLQNAWCRAASRRELRRLTDRDLRDIGIERHQIDVVVERLLAERESGQWRRYQPWRPHRDR